MEELKFRAWSRIGKRFLYGTLMQSDFYATWDADSIDGEEDDTELIILDLEPWQQYTNLKDKNGKKIYNGDIIEYMYAGKKIRRAVEWDTLGAAFTRVAQNPYDNEVVGNIYENPEFINNM